MEHLVYIIRYICMAGGAGGEALNVCFLFRKKIIDHHHTPPTDAICSRLKDNGCIVRLRMSFPSKRFAGQTW